MAAGKLKQSGIAKKVVGVSKEFVIDCTLPVNDNVVDPQGLAKFFLERAKVDGLAGNLKGQFKVQQNGAIISIQTTAGHAKRYFKYLTKKYLKRQMLRDYLRLIADKPNSYQLRYYHVAPEAEEA